MKLLYAEDEAAIRRFAARVPVSRILVNTPGALGGVGATTNLFPALTLGCGAVGGSSSSNNIGPLDLINIRRIAWGVRDKQELAANLIHYCKERNILVLAEGVERIEEVHTMLLLGADLFQGYYFGRPELEIRPVNPYVIEKMRKLLQK